MSFKIETGTIKLCESPEINEDWNNEKLRNASYFSEGLGIALDESTGLYGFLNLNGKIEILCKFRDAYGFSEGLASVQDAKTGLWGTIDKIGNVVTPFRFSKPCHFKEGLASININDSIKGYIDRSGEIAISTHKYWFISSFSEGLAVVQSAKTGLYGYIDKNGNEVIPCMYVAAKAFSDGMAVVKNDKYDYGYIDKEGKLAIPCQYFTARPFKNGLAWVENKIGTEYYINKQNEKLKLENRNFMPVRDFSERYGVVQNKITTEYYYINTDGKTVFADYEPGGDFQDGFAFATERKTGKNNFIGIDGKPKNKTKYLLSLFGGYQTENGIVIPLTDYKGSKMVLNTDLDILFQVERYYLRILPSGKILFFNTKEKFEKAVKEIEEIIKRVNRYSQRTKNIAAIDYLIDEQDKKDIPYTRRQLSSTED